MKKVIGVDLGGMSAKAAVLREGAALEKRRVETSPSYSVEEIADRLAALCVEAARAADLGMDGIDGVGIGSPGVVDSANGTVVNWSNYGWKDVPLAALVGGRLHKPVFVTNDANAAALGEAVYGAGKRYSDSILITLGTGVGGGIVIGGKLFEGFRSAGAEIGHIVIRQNGDLCTCGRRGCLERYASASALIRLTVEEMRRCPESLLWKLSPEPDRVDGKTAFDAARAGDEAGKRIVAEYVAALGEGIVDLANIFRPQAVLLGGGVSAEGEDLLRPLREYVFPRLYVPASYAPFVIECAALGNDAGLYGAAEYASARL